MIFVVAVAILAGCSPSGIKGDGTIKTEDRPVSGFSKLVVTGAYRIKWSSGKPALNISTDQNLLPLVETVVNGDTLQIESKQNLSPTKGITITLTSPSLADVQLTGANSFNGSQITGHDLKLEADGASSLSVDGSVTNLEVNLTGASHLSANSLQAQTAKVTLVGTSQADITVADTLNASVTGVGLLTYSGNPKSVVKDVNGPGIISKRP